MTRLSLFLFVACTHHPPAPIDIHAQATCDTAWTNNGFTECETACADSSIALFASGPSCDARTTEGTAVSCSKTFDADAGDHSVTGCCASDTPRLLFAECQ